MGFLDRLTDPNNTGGQQQSGAPAFDPTTAVGSPRSEEYRAGAACCWASSSRLRNPLVSPIR